MKKFVTFVRATCGRILMVLAIVLGLAFGVASASAQTDITGTVTALSGYWDTIAALAITVVLFVLGRRLLRKL